MVKNNRAIRLPHPLYFSSMRHWLTLLSQYGSQFRGRDRWRAAKITLVVAAASPIRIFESVRFGNAIRSHKLSQPPVFIVGHWRSGTTNLHNLMLQDSAFASVKLLHCAIPWGFLTCEWLARRIMKHRLPSSRPMDAVPLGIDEPMSEDFAMAGMTHMSHYLNYFFPQIAELTFRRTVLFEDVSEDDMAHYGKTYEYLLKKVSWASGGARLLLKNPPGLGRIPELLRRYPDAKFIHVYRNPWLVHASTMKLMDRFCEQLAFQDPQTVDLEHFVSSRYAAIMDRWIQTRSLIPDGQLIELRHEDITASPVEVVRDVYQALNLPNWEATRTRLQRYAESLRGYQNNRYDFSADYLRRLRPFLQPIAEQLGYQQPATEACIADNPVAPGNRAAA
jgi:omega-hydroxy-beta-dihydromenaquinone-9 sulfotransferase